MTLRAAPLRALLVPGLLLAWAGACQAQAVVYRCGPGGHHYADTPCPGGREVRVADGRTPEQQGAALALAQETQERARQLESERQQAEAAHPPAAAFSFHANPPSARPEAESGPALVAPGRSSNRPPHGEFRALVPKAASSAPEQKK